MTTVPFHPCLFSKCFSSTTSFSALAFQLVAHQELPSTAGLWWDMFILSSKSTWCVAPRWYTLSGTLLLNLWILGMNGWCVSWMQHGEDAAAWPNLSLISLSDRGSTKAISATVCCACQVPTACIVCQKDFPQLAMYLLQCLESNVGARGK